MQVESLINSIKAMLSASWREREESYGAAPPPAPPATQDIRTRELPDESCDRHGQCGGVNESFLHEKPLTCVRQPSSRAGGHDTSGAPSDLRRRSEKFYLSPSPSAAVPGAVKPYLRSEAVVALSFLSRTPDLKARGAQ